MQAKIKSTKWQTAIGIIIVAAFIVSTFAVAPSLSLNRIASAGYGSSSHHKSKKKKKKTTSSQTTIQKKVNDFQPFNTVASISAYRTVAALRSSNPARFKALQNLFNRYYTVGGRLKVQPSPQTVAALNQYRSYTGYAAYLNYLGKLKK